MIGSQPAILAAISADRPTAPTPNTAKLSPAFGCITLSTAPAPVWPPQASAQTLLERHVVAHLHREALVGDGEVAERRLLEEGAVDRLAVLRMQGRAVGARAAVLEVVGVDRQ